MEMVKVALVVVLLLTSVFCQDMDVDTWTEDIKEYKWPNSEVIQDILMRMTRKPGPRHYSGLTGKTDSARTQTARKRHKFKTFVGLMGKRSFADQSVMLSARALHNLGGHFGGKLPDGFIPAGAQ